MNEKANLVYYIAYICFPEWIQMISGFEWIWYNFIDLFKPNNPFIWQYIYPKCPFRHDSYKRVFSCSWLMELKIKIHFIIPLFT